MLRSSRKTSGIPKREDDFIWHMMTKTGGPTAKYLDRKTASFKYVSMYLWIRDVHVLMRNVDNRWQYVQERDQTIWIPVCLVPARNSESHLLVLVKVPQRPCLWIKECWTSNEKCICFCTACKYKSSGETFHAVPSRKGLAGAKDHRVYKSDVLLPPTPFPTDNGEIMVRGTIL